MTVIEAVRKSMSNCNIGDIFTTEEIKKIVSLEYGKKKSSVIPSDYCFNITNNGIHNYIDYFHIFLQKEIGVYQYAGEDCMYTGIVTNKGVPVGRWENGKI